ncbi:MBL fold metallo-hydrolase [Mesobacillus thioparans]|uniref:MBL fold metallo-hydrolase n=1 Tax=Mesobacillus thioparans TaxID=370439 RepID=UPI0039EFD598
MDIQLIRQATMKIQYNGHIILVDPMFSPRGSLDPVANAANDKRNPLVDLPFPVEEILKEVEAVMITHMHRDHLDDAAIQSLPKDIVVFCQPEDEGKLQEHGFLNVVKVNSDVQWNGIKLSRTGGRHGTGELARAMGPVSGFILEADSEENLYIAGDTVWCDETEDAIRNYKPGVIIVNGGEAQFKTGDPITMGLKDIVKVRNQAADSLIVVVHMEAWNHCLLKRETVMNFIEDNELKNVIVPNDGEKITR